MNPEYVKIDSKKYKIDTDFRTALECNEIAEDPEVGEHEKALAIIYKLFGDEGLEDKKNYDQLLKKALLYLLCGKEREPRTNETPDMNFEQDRGLIKASFFSDYKVENIFDRYMHWYDFNDYMNGLTENCVLNYARYVRSYDISQIKDSKERTEWIKRKKSFELKQKKKVLNTKQIESSSKFAQLAKLERK